MPLLTLNKSWYIVILLLVAAYYLSSSLPRYEGFSCGCGGILPVTNPWYNLREICKNTILLEDHIFQRSKRCKDCIKKHFLTIEGLAEEMVTLDKTQQLKEYYGLADQIRNIEKEYIERDKKGKSIIEIAQKLRIMRKSLMVKCFEVL